MTGTVDVDAVELRRVRMPLRAPWRTSYGIEHARDVLLVRVRRAGGADGWGECGALSTPGYSAEWVDGAHEVLRRFLVPALLDGAVAHVESNPMAKAALEMALLDAQLRAASTPLATYLGGVRSLVEAGVAVGIMEPVARLIDEIDAFVAQGYRRVKLKIEPGRDVPVVRAVRSRFPDLALQVDANGAYTADNDGFDALCALDPFDLLLVEQPFPADALLAHAELARRSSTPVCLDESITSASSVQAAITLGACSVVNIKAARVGGLLEARRVHDVCVDAGVPVWCGGMLETGIGRAANVALAALPGFTLPGDLSASERYYEHDIAGPWLLDDGCLHVPVGPGLGVEPDADALAAATTSVEEFTRRSVS